MLRLPVLQVRCPGIRWRLSPRALDMVAVLVAILAIFPVTAAWGLSHPHSFLERGSQFASHLAGQAMTALQTTRPASAPSGVGCEEIAEGIERLGAELSVAYYAPRSEKELSNLHYLTEARTNQKLSHDTNSLASGGLTMLHDFFRMAQEDPASLYVRKPLFLTNWNSLLRDLSVSVRKDCGVVARVPGAR